MENINPNETQSQSQCGMILKALQHGERLTAIDALEKFGCFRLGARIYDLRMDGWHIFSTKIKTESGKWVSEYYMGARREEI